VGCKASRVARLWPGASMYGRLIFPVVTLSYRIREVGERKFVQGTWYTLFYNGPISLRQKCVH
jgi:hypothetical protein